MNKYKKITQKILIVLFAFSLSAMLCNFFTKVILGECKADSEKPDKKDIQEENLSEIERKELEERVNQLLKKDDVNLIRDVEEVFLLADVYAREGRDKEAIDLYQEALKVDSWRLKYQLKLAHLLYKFGDTNQAIEKAKVVHQYAEDETLILETEELLSALGVEFVEEKEQGFVKDIEIIMVPIGKVNRRLLDESRKELQKIIGIKYSIAEKQLDVGEMDRTYADRYLTDIVVHIKSELSPEVEELLHERNLTELDLETFKGKIKFVNGFFGKIELSQGEIDEFHSYLKELKVKGQFDASRLASNLKENFVTQTDSSIKGYLGITEEDIFSDDDNFLFGWAKKGYGVISYHRFMATFNKESPNRLKLRERMVKQAISSSFFILGIPRCTTPACARAYPHSLNEHDQKEIKLCNSCKTQLVSYIKKNRMGIIETLQHKLIRKFKKIINKID